MNNRWLIVLLLISLALNLLIVGMLIGRFTGAASQKPFPPHLGWIVRQLEPEQRKALANDLRQFEKKDRELRRDVMTAQKSVNDLLLADDLDKSALEKQLAVLRETSLKAQTSLHEAMIRIMLSLDPEQRRHALDVLRRNWRGEFRKHRSRSHAANRGNKTPSMNERSP